MAADFTINIKLDGSDVKRGAAGVRAEMKSIASTDFSRLKAQLQQVGEQVGRVGSAISGAGRTLSVAVTAPLGALAALGVRSALELDKARTKIAALVGDSEKANAKITALQRLADRSVGVTRAAALETFAQLKGLGGIADESIDKIIASMGKLNAAFDIEDQAGFMRNLTQIFSQGFEIADLKEAIGRVPIFKQLLEQAFGTSDGAKLKQLKESGKLTMDTFLGGISEAINNDPRTGQIGENLSTKLTKGLERLNNALAPIGQIILDAIVPVLEKTEPYIQQLSDWFQSLSPWVQKAVVVFLALAAAVGPLLIGFASLVATLAAAIGSAAALGTAFAAIGIAGLVVVGLLLQLGPLLAVVAAQTYLLYQAWERDFKGIRTLTLQLFESVKATVNAGLAAINAFWAQHGQRIMAVVNAAWTAIKSVVQAGLGLVGNVIRLALQVINGDWSGAWQTFLEIVKDASLFITEILSGLREIVGKALAALLPIIVQYGVSFASTMADWAGKAVVAVVAVFATLPVRLIRLIPQFIAAGRSIISAVYEGIKQGFQPTALAAGVVDLSGAVAVEAGGMISSVADAVTNNSAKIGKVAEAAKVAEKALTPLEELRKQLSAAKDAYDLLAKNDEAQRLTVETAKYQDQKSALEELLKLREKHQMNMGFGLPETLSGINKEIAGINATVEAKAELLKINAEISRSAIAERINLGEQIKTYEAQATAGRELTLVEKQRIANFVELTRKETEWRNSSLDGKVIAELRSKLEYEQGVTLEKLKQLENARQIAAANAAGRDLVASLDTEIADLNVQLGLSAELSRADAIAKTLQSDAYKGLSEETKKLIIAKAEESDRLRALAKSQQEAKRVYDDVFGSIRDSLRTLRDEGFGGFFKSVLRKFQDFLLDMAAEWITSKFFQMFFNGGNQPAAQQGGSGGGILGQILGGLFGNGTSGGVYGGPTTPPFNSNFLSSGGGAASGSIVTLPNGEQAVQVNAGGGGRLATGLTIAGSAASMIGGMIGGRAGGFLSNIGSGVAMGAQIGSIIPGIGTAVGAIVGGAVGFFASLFGGDPKRKRDKEEKLPQLQRGFTDALAELRSLVADVRTLRVSPDSALARASELRNQIASGFGIQFESKKYRKEAQSIISRRTREADALIAELRQVSEVARAASERDRRLIPEFAGGVYISPSFRAFQRKNGMLAGAWTGRDTIPAMLARGEMVLNPHQQRNVIRNAGGKDVFAHAAIPGYAGGTYVGPTAAATPMAMEMPDINVTVMVEQDFQGNWNAAAQSDAGIKVTTQVIEKQFANDRLKLQRRGA